MTSGEPGKLRAAFSLRRNVARWLTPTVGGPGHRLPPLDGLRALAVLWVVLFHTAWYARFCLPPATWLALFVSPWMVPVWRGDFGVDVFFVLSGFLIGGLLLDERSRAGRVAFGRFYARRALRLWPVLLVVAALKLASDDPLRRNVWANVLYVNDFLPVLSVPLGWTWSLAIEEQFYLACPWLLLGLAPLRPVVRVLSLGLLASSLVAVGAGVVIRYGFRAWDAEVVANVDLPHWARAFDLFYDKPWMRAGALLAGVSAAVAYRETAWMSWVSTRTGPVAAAVALSAGLMALSTHWPVAEGARRWVEVLYLASFRTVFGFATAFVLLVTLSQHPLGRSIARPLGTRLLFPIAQLAYPAYLVNPLVCLGVGDALKEPLSTSAHPLAVLIPCNLVGTFACALVLHVAVERPFMQLRR